MKPLVIVIDDMPGFIPIEDWRDAIEADFEVITDPRQALTSPRLKEATCILLDHRMPHMTGAEVAVELRAMGVTVPIYKTGSFNESGYPEDCMHIGKMLSNRVMKAVLKNALGEITREDLLHVIHKY